MDLLLDLPAGLGRRAALEHALRQAIADGQLEPGAALPSTRQLAQTLALARGTVVDAVEQLAAEGLVETRHGALSRVAHVPPSAPARTTAKRLRTGTRAAADFSPGNPDLTTFPRAMWASAVRRALGTCDAASLGYGNPQGHIELRRALVEYLGRTRGVTATPDDIVVTAGFTQALAAIGRAARSVVGDDVVVEDPSLDRHRILLDHAGLRLIPVAVDSDGVRVDEMPEERATALVTPGHHTPLGVSLSSARRGELATWAARHEGLVVEDDYDGELRYDRRPVRAFQALDPGRVAYCGTASKSFAPGLRLAWCVLPHGFVEPVLEAMWSIGGWAVSAVEQLTLADIMGSGGYDRHVRMIRHEYRRRRDMLLAALTTRVPSVRVEGVAAGLNAMVVLPQGTDEGAAVEALAERSVAVFGLTTFAVDPDRCGHSPAIVVNYGRPYGHRYRESLDRLVDALAAVLS